MYISQLDKDSKIIILLLCIVFNNAFVFSKQSKPGSLYVIQLGSTWNFMSAISNCVVKVSHSYITPPS